MKRFLLAIAGVLLAIGMNAQVKSAAPQNVLRGLVPDKWQVQHYHIGFDGRTMVLSALVPGTSQYDLYILSANRGVWGKPQKMDVAANSDANEYWPCISPDGQTLYFVRQTGEQSRKEDARFTLMMCNRTENGWTVAQALIVSDGYDVSPYMLPDNRTLLLSRGTRASEKKPIQYGLYRMERLDKVNWTEPVPVLLPTEKEMHYYGFGGNGQHLRYTIETINRKDTTCVLGDYTLPDSLRWKPVLTLQGKTLNGEGRLLNANIVVHDGVTGKTLASYRTDGQYKLPLPCGTKYVIDVYAEGTNHRYLEPDCRMLDRDSLWTCDFRLQKELELTMNVYDALDNTHLEQSMHTLSIGKVHRLSISHRAYRDTTITIDTRNPVLMTRSELDIALVPATVALTVRVVDEEKDSLLEERQLLARQGTAYPMHLEVVGYTYADTTIRVPFRSEDMLVRVPLRSLRTDMVMQLRNIQFEYNSAELKEESFEELHKVVRLLEMNRELRIELSAHTDDVGTDAYNDRLSSRRGETVRQYIVANGIAPERILAKGYGKRHPLVPNDSEEHRAQNRRVEFKIIGL